MFDANMGSLPTGHRFFAKVHFSCNTDFLPSNTMFLCEMVEADEDDPEVLFVDSGRLIRNNECDDAFIVYEGNEDLTGFISKTSLKEAKELLC